MGSIFCEQRSRCFLVACRTSAPHRPTPPHPTPPRTARPAPTPHHTDTAVSLTRTPQGRGDRGRGRGAELPGGVAVGEPPPAEVPRLPAGVSEVLLQHPPRPVLSQPETMGVSPTWSLPGPEERLTMTPNRTLIDQRPPEAWARPRLPPGPRKEVAPCCGRAHGLQRHRDPPVQRLGPRA